MGLFDKLRSAGLWQTAQIIIQVVAQFTYISVMARLLTKADFGLMALASSFIGIGTIFSEGGMGAALIQRKNVNQKHINAALQGSILLGVIISALVIIIAPYIAIYFEQPVLDLLIKVVSINIILHSISGISQGLLHKNFRFNKTAGVTIFALVIGYAVGIVLGYKDYGVWSLVAAVLITSFIKALGFLYFAPIRFSLMIYVKEWKELFSFGSGMILLKINNYFASSGLILVLGKILTPDLLGVFERTSKIKILPSVYLGNVLDSIMFPAMSEIQDEHERLFKIYQFSLGVINSILMPVALYLIFFSKEIVLILLGNKWLDAVLPLQIMFIVLPFSSSGRMADSVIRARGLIYKNVYRKALYVVVLMVTVSLGAIYFGLIGAAAAVTFSFLFNYINMLFLVKRIFKKGIKEIFWETVLSGIKLSFFMGLLLIILTAVFNNWDHTNLTNFFLISFITVLIIGFLIWKKPSFLGIYLNTLLYKLRNKQENNI